MVTGKYLNSKCFFSCSKYFHAFLQKLDFLYLLLNIHNKNSTSRKSYKIAIVLFECHISPNYQISQSTYIYWSYFIKTNFFHKKRCHHYCTNWSIHITLCFMFTLLPNNAELWWLFFHIQLFIVFHWSNSRNLHNSRLRLGNDKGYTIKHNIFFASAIFFFQLDFLTYN